MVTRVGLGTQGWLLWPLVKPEDHTSGLCGYDANSVVMATGVD